MDEKRDQKRRREEDRIDLCQRDRGEGIEGRGRGDDGGEGAQRGPPWMHRAQVPGPGVAHHQERDHRKPKSTLKNTIWNGE
jgi:hypothetical protein